jgi:hypothetical protein
MTVFANESMVLLPDNPAVICNISIVGIASLKVKAGGSGVYKDGLLLSVSAITFGSATIPDPAVYVVPLNASIMNCKADGDLILVEGDESDMINATPQTPSSPNPIDTPVSFKIKIEFAGQTKVKGN